MMHRKVGVVQNREAPATSAPPGCCQSPASVRVGEQGEKMKINLLGRRQLTFHVFVSSYTASHQYNAPLGKIGGVEFIFCEFFCTSCDTACQVYRLPAYVYDTGMHFWYFRFRTYAHAVYL
jgi:hypothetical protein